jgi:FkbM family methyltransferase
LRRTTIHEITEQARVMESRVKVLSYAQNMEDIHLAAIFSGQSGGFYIDVGGGHPVADNVSLMSYLAGWSGVVVEPQAHLHALYARVRPRDVALATLVGRASGEAAFHVVDRLHGFSTMVEANAKGASGFGAGYVTEKRPVTTLADICGLHAPARIDWLKIDVEGAEADVIAGGDWTRHRPRLVLVEAIEPGSMKGSEAAWEPLLLAADYRFVFFDGLNRFYLAAEAEDLASRIPTEFQDWGGVRHLYDHGRAVENRDHPDHALASALMGLPFERVPSLGDDEVFARLTKNMRPEHLADPASADTIDRYARLWLGTEPFDRNGLPAPGRPLGDALKDLMASDPFRVALGRIAAPHDGGFINDD